MKKLKQISTTKNEKHIEQENITDKGMLQLRKKENNIILKLIVLIKKIFRRK